LRFVDDLRHPWQGRIGRLDYLVQLPLFAVAGSAGAILLMALPVHAIRLTVADDSPASELIQALLVIGFLGLSGLAVSIPVVRRLHDLNRSGRPMWLGLAATIATVVTIRQLRLAESPLALPLLLAGLGGLLAFGAATLLLAGSPDPNRYGAPRRR
jgi:uncharacterized membrane protein YhaH (DUF805 family)